MTIFSLLALACVVLSANATSVIDTVRYNIFSYNVASVERKNDRVHVTLYFYFEHDIETQLFTNIGAGIFGLLVQPPCYLELIKEDKAFSRISSIPEPSEFSKFWGIKSYTDKISQKNNCKADSFVDFLKRGFEPSYQYEAGIFVHGTKDLEVLPDVSNTKNLGVQNICTLGYHYRIPGGLYSWTGIYKHRICSRNTTGVFGYYSDWIVALIAENAMSETREEDLICFASDPLSAKIMLSKISKHKHISLLSCLGMGDMLYAGNDPSVLPDIKMKARFVQNPEAKEKHVYEIKFKIDQSHNVHNIKGDTYKLILTCSELKKDSTSVIEIYGKSKKTFTYTYLKESNSYDIRLDRSEIDIDVTYTIMVDFTKLLELDTAKIPPMIDWKLDIFLISTGKHAKELTEEEISKMEFDHLGENVDIDAYKKEIKTWYKKVTQNRVSDKITKVGSGSATVDLSRGYVHLPMKITKTKGSYLLKVYLENNTKTKNKNFILTIRSPGKIDGEILPVNPLKPSIYEITDVPKYYHAEVKKNEINVRLYLNDTKSKDLSDKSYFEIPLYFSSNMYFEEFVKIMSHFDVKLYNEDDKIDLPVLSIKVIEDLPPIDKDDGFFLELESSLSGPYISHQQGKTTIIMSIFGPIHSRMLLSIIFDKHKVSDDTFSVNVTSKFILKSRVIHVEDSNELIIVMDSYTTVDVDDMLFVTITCNDSHPIKTDKLKITLLSEQLNYMDVLREFVDQKEDIKYNWNYVSMYEVVDMEYILENPIVTSACVSKTNRLVSSPFRNNNTGTYILTRIHDCSRPWMPILISNPDEVSLNVTHKSTTGVIGLFELLNMKRSGTNSVEAFLIENMQFLEYTLHILFDSKAVNSIVKQLGESRICESNDATCNESYKMFTIKYFLTDFFRKYKSDLFTRVNYSYYDDQNNNVTICSLDLKTDMDHRCRTKVTDVTSHKLAFEHVLDNGFAHVNPDSMTESFSVVALIGEDAVEKLRGQLKKYEKPSDPSSNNGKLLHPIFINVIPMGVDSMFEFSGAKSALGLTVPNVVTEHALETKDVKQQRMNTNVLENVYNGFTFQHPDNAAADILSPSTEGKSALKGVVAYEPTQRQTKRDTYEIFFGFNTDGHQDPDGNTYPVHRKLFDAIVHVENTFSKSHYVFSTCAHFPGIRESVGECKYTLSYKGSELQTFELSAGDQSKFGEKQTCNVFSIFKNVPATLHSTIEHTATTQLNI
ncbi:conserved hypothetical protein [Theileria equi strain WA]|uniref:Signal peptide-containing protein n=1 Tax=Theileria equi strain WA TaxID=1537102 RepID=L1L9W3_THEEQ|nr:conserved hypothetical protein [Theileria equi strain WA]EKX72044.1 conserved hypothetical protein [Theileria equi strain WA]|eukprot:XP_004831496.1 conserved hypothetical protein [Theileria equi strain WA]